MMKPLFAGTALILITACAPDMARKEITLLTGFRDPGDQCRVVAENAYTNQFLGDSSALVACPTGAENLGVFVEETNAKVADRVGAYTLYTVPLG